MRVAPVTLVATLLVSGSAAASVSTPYPGVTLVEEAGRKLVIANLCTPGVSIRATKYGERKGTPQTWAEKVDAEVASNADFFEFPGWSWVQGRARGGGEDWPAGSQWISEQDRSFWQFGPFLAGNVHPGTTAPSAGATDIFAGHDLIIEGGKVGGPWTGDFYNGPHTRTAFGMSADHRTVYLMVTTAAVGVGTVAGFMQTDAATAGAPPIETATNLDGGGSSQLYVKGRGQIISTGRLVNNHVGIFAKGSGAAPNCPNHPPTGFLDSASCDAIKGWAQDADAPTKALDVHLYFDGVPGGPNAGARSVLANRKRPDLCTPLGSCDHGFDEDPPLSLQDGKPHTVRAYAIDTDKGTNPELSGGAKTFTCKAKLPAGVRRHVGSPASLASWKFRLFEDLVSVDEAVFSALPRGTDLPATRVLMRADDGSPEVWIVDGKWRRHVPSAAIAARWQIDLATVAVWPAAKVQLLSIGPKLRAAPFLVRGSGPAVDLLDDDPDAPPASPDAGPSAGDAGVDGGDPAAESDDTGAACAMGRTNDGALFVFAAAFLVLRRRRTG